jgi:hypothetical protein
LTVSHLPLLSQSLQGQDLSFLKYVAEAWELDAFNPPDARSGIQLLTSHLLNAKLLEQVLLDLPEAALDAFFDLAQNDGQMAWALFTRRYGALRNFGAARRDRERPQLFPASQTEALWYRGLIGRSFFDTTDGPQEFAYIPQDLLGLAPRKQPDRSHVLGRTATLAERVNPFLASDKIVDHACTLLAAKRAGQFDLRAFGNWAGAEFGLDVFIPFLERCLVSAGLMDANGLPAPEPVRKFLELNRGAALINLLQAWLTSLEVNDLRLLPGLVFEGKWQNNPLRTRQIVLELLSSCPGQEVGLPWLSESSRRKISGADRPYVNLQSFIQAVYQDHPDFQRPAGDYDSWFIRDSQSGEYLRGFDHWVKVDGAFLKYIICGPLHWIGLIDLAGPTPVAQDTHDRISAFRLSINAQDLLNQKILVSPEKENELWVIRSDGRILAPRQSARSDRYQIARFCDSEGLDKDLYQYRLTPASLERSRQQGLQVTHLLKLLRRHSKTVPPTVQDALERWEAQGAVAHFEKVILLRVKNPEVLQSLRTSRAARFLGDPLGPTTITVKPGAIEAIVNILLEMGYLSDVTLDD